MSSPTAAVIRKACLADSPRLAEFNRHLAMETEQISLSPEVTLAGVRAVFSAPGGESRGFYLVAEADGAVRASLLITFEWSDWRCGEFWWIQSVYVDQAWRRRGLYQALYRHARELAAARDVCGFRLYAAHDNHAAAHTYEALGMHDAGYRMYEQTLQRRETAE